MIDEKAIDDRPAAYPSDEARSESSERAAGAALGASMIAMGLISGVYYAFSCAVMPGLARADDRTFLDVMRRINDAIVNPVFMLSFFGAFVLTGTAAALQRRLGKREATPWIAAAAALYGAALAVTVAANIPLNDEIARPGSLDAVADLAGLRQRFEGSWNLWNDVRGLASVAALACLGRALVLHGRESRSAKAPGK
ncbi:membrane protein [Capsulimonas corticalis]|uniref:Membrane protein n=1 Tax=Capsulimonas corticalis TaxID=2219043 RepID=A0A402CTS0_9BACT|nr:anthrone oxygenase family protein [Capsulimonas corticalis]BDI30645.1 membrane protein [Capsulimonas corticalis]